MRIHINAAWVFGRVCSPLSQSYYGKIDKRCSRNSDKA